MSTLTLRNRPISLAAVAAILIVLGVWAVITQISYFRASRAHLVLDILDFFAGIGILRFRRGWRIYALVVAWIGILGGGILIFAGLFGFAEVSGETSIGSFHFHVSRVTFLFIVSSYVLLHTWICYILTRPEIRARFYSDVHQYA